MSMAFQDSEPVTAQSPTRGRLVVSSRSACSLAAAPVGKTRGSDQCPPHLPARLHGLACDFGQRAAQG